jgi:hypothetical protein
MQDRIFGDREKAMEEAYFRQEDAKLLKKLQDKAHLDEIALALGEKLQIDNPDLLQRVKDEGVTLDTAPALFLAPLVQVAWANGSVSKAEHHAVVRLARGRGMEADSPAYAQIEAWLKKRPDDSLFDTAVEVIKYGFSVLSRGERDERIKRLVDACHEVAESSGSTLGFVLGLKNVMGLNSVDSSEATVLDLIANRLRRPPQAA